MSGDLGSSGPGSGASSGTRPNTDSRPETGGAPSGGAASCDAAPGGVLSPWPYVFSVYVFSIGLILVLLAAFSLHEIKSLDIGWHIRAGEYILSNLTVPGNDIFSYTATDRPYLDSHWLFQVLAYLFSLALGLNGLHLLVLTLVVLTFGLLISCSGMRDRPLIGAVFFVPAVIACADRFMARPELMSFLFIACYLLILGRCAGNNTNVGAGAGANTNADIDSSTATRLIFLIPVLQVLWVNSHGLFVLGPALVGARVFAGLLAGWEATGKRLPFFWREQCAFSGTALRRHLVVLVLTFLACLVNPYGLELTLYPLTLFTEVSDKTNIVASTVRELTPPFSGSAVLNLESVFFYKLLFAGSLVTFALNFRRINLFYAIVYVAFFYLSTLAVRNVALFALVAPVAATLNMASIRWGEWGAETGKTGDPFFKALRAKAGPLVAPLTAVALIIVTAVTAYYVLSLYTNDYYMRNGRYTRSGLGLSKVIYPVGATDFLKEHRPEGNIFNTAGFGGYLIWRLYPEAKVFIDGRWEVYGDRFLTIYYRALKDPVFFESLARGHKVGQVILGTGSKRLMHSLLRSPLWEPVYCGDVAFVFTRNTAQNQGLITSAGSSGGCRFPAEAADLRALERLYLERKEESTLRRMLRRGFSSDTPLEVPLEVSGDTSGYAGDADYNGEPLLHSFRAVFFSAMGRLKRAEAEYLKSLAVFPHHQQSHIGLAFVYMDLGDYGRAIREFRFTLDLNPRNPKALKYLKRLGVGVGEGA